MINLTKKVIGNGKLRISEDRQYVTNGHWLCRRDLCKQLELLGSLEAARAYYSRAKVAEVSDAHVRQVLPRYKNPITYTRTSWIQIVGDIDAVLFVGDEDSQIWIDRTYVDLFDLDEIAAPLSAGKASLDPGVVKHGGECQIVIMPVHAKYQGGLR